MLALNLLVVHAASAQEAGATVTFQDAFLDDLVGTWTMTGHVMGDSVTCRADAEWVLDHQFVRLRMEDMSTPSEYAAHVYIGYDTAVGAYTAHWLDTTGGRNAKALGTGQRRDSTLTFQFEYANGPFQTVFVRTPNAEWRIRMRTQSDSTTWRPFASYRLTPRAE